MIALPTLPHPLQVKFQLLVNGVDITNKINNRLVSLRLTDNAGDEADTLSITLSDHDGEVELPPHNATLTLALGGKEDDLIDKGSFIVDETSHEGAPDLIVIVARSADFQPAILQGRRSRSWNRKTLKDIVSDIASDLGIEYIISDQLAGKRILSMHQTDETDYNFLSRVADNYDAHLNVKQNTLYFVKKGGLGQLGQALPMATITRLETSNHRYLTQDREAYTGVRAKWNDVAYGRLRYIVAGKDEKLTLLPGTYASEADAQAAAWAELAKIQRGQFALTLNLSCPRLDVVSGQPLKVEGFKKQIDAEEWVVKTVEHGFDGGSPFVTSVQAELLYASVEEEQEIEPFDPDEGFDEG